jgi:hypothetical protein
MISRPIQFTGAGPAHHLAPFFVFGADERAEFLRSMGVGVTLAAELRYSSGSCKALAVSA